MSEEMREMRTLEDACTLLDEWTAAYQRLWLDYMKLNDRLIDAKLDHDMTDARLTVMRGEAWLAAHPPPRVSRFEEMALDESDPFG